MANIVVRPKDSLVLPDKGNYINRFKVRSASSSDEYVVAQHRSGRWWSCGCFGWIRWKHCHHLDELGLPGNHRPYEALLEAHR